MYLVFQELLLHRWSKTGSLMFYFFLLNSICQPLGLLTLSMSCGSPQTAAHEHSFTLAFPHCGPKCSGLQGTSLTHHIPALHSPEEQTEEKENRQWRVTANSTIRSSGWYLSPWKWNQTRARDLTVRRKIT